MENPSIFGLICLLNDCTSAYFIQAWIDAVLIVDANQIKMSILVAFIRS